MAKVELTSMSADELGAMLRGLEISLQYIGSRSGKRATERLIQQCIDEKHRRDEIVVENYHRRMKESRQ